MRSKIIIAAGSSLIWTSGRCTVIRLRNDPDDRPALQYLESSKGWEIGVGPSVVVADEGLARSLTTSTAKEDIYAFFFGQEGLMAGMGLQGSKISRIEPDRECDG